MSNLIEKAKQRTLKAVASVLKRISASSRIIGPPRGYYQTMKDYLVQENVPANRYHKVFDAEHSLTVTTEPQTIDETVHWRFAKNAHYFIPEQYVVEIPNGRVTGKNCIVITPGDKVIAEVSRQFGVNDDYSKAAILRKIKLPALTKFDGVLGVAGYAGGDNYWHWTFDILPRIYLLQQSGLIHQCDKILINPLHLPYQQHTLTQLGIPMDKFVYSGDQMHIQAKKLLVPGIPEHKDHIPYWSLEFLRGLFKPAPKATSFGKKIFITRKKARNRKIVNEDALLNILQPLGFNVLALEDLTVSEQVQLFEQADVLIAPHGASQTNLIYSRPGTTIIELFSPGWIHYLYWSMSAQLGIRYYYLIAEGEAPSEDNFVIDKGADLFININKFKLLLIKAGIINTDVVFN
jgi:capsular polysaccharide biosynthesis protein